MSKETTIMGIRIRELRKQNDWTMEELGNKIGVNKTAVSKWENGDTKNIKQSTILKLATVFGVQPSYIMGFNDSEYMVDQTMRKVSKSVKLGKCERVVAEGQLSIEDLFPEYLEEKKETKTTQAPIITEPDPYETFYNYGKLSPENKRTVATLINSLLENQPK